MKRRPGFRFETLAFFGPYGYHGTSRQVAVVVKLLIFPNVRMPLAIT